MAPTVIRKKLASYFRIVNASVIYISLFKSGLALRLTRQIIDVDCVQEGIMNGDSTGTVPALVIDTGGSLCKAGFAGDDSFRAAVPTTLFHPAAQGDTALPVSIFMFCSSLIIIIIIIINLILVYNISKGPIYLAQSIQGLAWCSWPLDLFRLNHLRLSPPGSIQPGGQELD